MCAIYPSLCFIRSCRERFPVYPETVGAIGTGGFLAFFGNQGLVDLDDGCTLWTRTVHKYFHLFVFVCYVCMHGFSFLAGIQATKNLLVIGSEIDADADIGSIGPPYYVIFAGGIARGERLGAGAIRTGAVEVKIRVQGRRNNVFVRDGAGSGEVDKMVWSFPGIFQVAPADVVQG